LGFVPRRYDAADGDAWSQNVQVVDGRLILSPSDLNDHVECAHLTTLALEVARGARAHPWVPAAYGDLLRRKGEEHERAYLATLREQGREVRSARTATRRSGLTTARGSAPRSSG
jgi:hypothetical protein